MNAVLYKANRLVNKGSRIIAAYHVSQSFDIIIVGAGIVGAACASECAAAGLKTTPTMFFFHGADRFPVPGAVSYSVLKKFVDSMLPR